MRRRGAHGGGGTMRRLSNGSALASVGELVLSSWKATMHQFAERKLPEGSQCTYWSHLPARTKVPSLPPPQITAPPLTVC